MKCYFCVSPTGTPSSVYRDMLEVCLRSVTKNTTLDPIVLFTGPLDHDWAQLISTFKVDLRQHRFSATDDLLKTFNPEYLQKRYGRILDPDRLTSTFMRFDIPVLETEDEYVLYCDFDVLFTGDVRSEDLPKPKLLAAAPEFNPDASKMTYFNAGVMILNVPAMREQCDALFQRLRERTPNNEGLFDQGYLNELCFNEFEILSNAYNWKPYWGYNPDAKIIHFHGMKPGGDNVSSGFAMNDEALETCLTASGLPFVEVMNGYTKYLQMFYDVLKRSDNGWIKTFSDHCLMVVDKDRVQRTSISGQN